MVHGSDPLKKCSLCKVIKSVEEFGKNKSRTDGRQHHCKPCACKMSAESYQRNREKVLKRAEKYRIINEEKLKAQGAEYRAAHVADRRAWCKEYYQKNSEAVLARIRANRNPEVEKIRAKAWRAKNPGVVLASNRARELSKIQRTPKWADLQAIKEFYKNCPTGYHVDHIVPLRGRIVSGLHVLNNLQYLTATDNLKKHNKFGG